jgi:hypothetical protein
MEPLGLLALLALFLMRRKGGASPAGTAATPAARADFANAWAQRTSSLMARARGGLAWVPRMSTLLGTPAAGAAAGRWIGIESGGDPRIASKLGERGLAQVSQQSLAELGLTQADYDAMTSARTTDDQHAALAARVIFGEIAAVTKAIASRAPDPGWGPALGPSPLTKGVVSVNGIGAAKLRHALPLLVRELADQNHIRTSIDATIRSMLTGGTVLAGTSGVRVAPFTPSAALAAFAGGQFKVTGDPAKDLALRFLAPVAVVALAEGSFALGAQAVA